MVPLTLVFPAARLKACRQTTRPMYFSCRKSILPILVTTTFGGWSAWGLAEGESSPAWSVNLSVVELGSSPIG